MTDEITLLSLEECARVSGGEGGGLFGSGTRTGHETEDEKDEEKG